MDGKKARLLLFAQCIGRWRHDRGNVGHHCNVFLQYYSFLFYLHKLEKQSTTFGCCMLEALTQREQLCIDALGAIFYQQKTGAKTWTGMQSVMLSLSFQRGQWWLGIFLLAMGKSRSWRKGDLVYKTEMFIQHFFSYNNLCKPTKALACDIFCVSFGKCVPNLLRAIRGNHLRCAGQFKSSIVNCLFLD